MLDSVAVTLFNIGLSRCWCWRVCVCFYDRSEPVTMAVCHFSHSVPEILSWTQSRLYPCSQCCISAAWLDVLAPDLAATHTSSKTIHRT